VLFRVFRETLSRNNAKGRRLIIYGAGAAGELLLRELRSNPGLGYHPVGFLDDDRRKRGRRIHGVKIYGGREYLDKVVRDVTAEEIVIAIPSLGAKARSELERACRQTGVTCRRMRGVGSTFLPGSDLRSGTC
jgi:FlaA1/EpsC-like NDP-sugar epimerase